MLQQFGTDLAETELPNDVQCTKDLLITHTEKHDKLKVAHSIYETVVRVGSNVVVHAFEWNQSIVFYRWSCEPFLT